MFHAITGLPRSGSTLFCNILNQNPALYASSTSNLPQMLRAVSHVWSTNPETKNLLNLEPDATDTRMTRTLQAIIGAWYSNQSGRVIFDKARGWGANVLMLAKILPKAKLIYFVRDPREVFASVEKQHARTATVSELPDNQMARASLMFQDDGLIGSCVRLVEDALRRKHPNAIFVQHSELAKNPAATMHAVYEFLELAWFDHDFENVVNTATDPDGFYLNKFPHKGEGKVQPPAGKWQDYVAEDVAKEIVRVCNFMGTRLGYW